MRESEEPFAAHLCRPGTWRIFWLNLGIALVILAEEGDLGVVE